MLLENVLLVDMPTIILFCSLSENIPEQSDHSIDFLYKKKKVETSASNFVPSHVLLLDEFTIQPASSSERSQRDRIPSYAEYSESPG